MNVKLILLGLGILLLAVAIIRSAIRSKPAGNEINYRTLNYGIGAVGLILLIVSFAFGSSLSGGVEANASPGAVGSAPVSNVAAEAVPPMPAGKTQARKPETKPGAAQTEGAAVATHPVMPAAQQAESYKGKINTIKKPEEKIQRPPAPAATAKAHNSEGDK